MALEKPGKLREFFLLRCGHPLSRLLQQQLTADFIFNPFTAGTHSSGFREKFGRLPEPSILVIANLLTAGVQ